MADTRIPASESHARARSRPGVIIAALLYLVAAYQRTPCPCVALCIVRHLDCLCEHEGAEPVIRQICGAVRETWLRAASEAPRAQADATRTRRPPAGATRLH